MVNQENKDKLVNLGVKADQDVKARVELRGKPDGSFLYQVRRVHQVHPDKKENRVQKATQVRTVSHSKDHQDHLAMLVLPAKKAEAELLAQPDQAEMPEKKVLANIVHLHVLPQAIRRPFLDGLSSLELRLNPLFVLFSILFFSLENCRLHKSQLRVH